MCRIGCNVFCLIGGGLCSYNCWVGGGKNLIKGCIIDKIRKYLDIRYIFKIWMNFVFLRF